MTQVADRCNRASEQVNRPIEPGFLAYDTHRRIAVLIDEFLSDDMIRGKRILDVGCGHGVFSQRFAERGGIVTATDTEAEAVAATRERVGCQAFVADACNLVQLFGESPFDVVFSSQCIEHTSSPRVALRQMAEVLKPDGYLSVSTPNVLWSPIVKLATKLRLRPSEGFENFSSWPGMREVLANSGIQIVRQKGLHLIPCQLPARRFSRWCDENLQVLRTAMLNICIVGRKESSLTRKLTEIEQSLEAVFGDGTI